MKKIKTIFYSAKFRKSFKKIPKQVKKKFYKLEETFRNDCFAAQLKTHKLGGEFKDYYSFSVSHSYRVMFEFYQDGVILINISTHGIYKNL